MLQAMCLQLAAFCLEAPAPGPLLAGAAAAGEAPAPPSWDWVVRRMRLREEQALGFCAMRDWWLRLGQQGPTEGAQQQQPQPQPQLRPAQPAEQLAPAAGGAAQDEQAGMAVSSAETSGGLLPCFVLLATVVLSPAQLAEL